MGITGSVPEPDDYAKRAIVLGNLSQKEVKKLYKIFRRYDKEKSGFAKLSVIFESIEEKRTIFTDSICDLLEIENDGKINFGAFLLMVTTYCLFEPREILKFCFFVFDQDKHGYFETDELKMLMNILHRVEDGETVKGNIKISWQNLKFGDDDRVDFEEFEHFHKEFPRLFQPAFSVQINMTRYIMGKRFWENKKNQLEAIRREEKLKQSKDKDSKAARAKRANERKTRKRMGLARYYCCPCLRFMYDGSVLPDQSQEVIDMKAKRAAEIAEAKRLAELRLKNPETQAWNKYKEKKETLVARGNTNFIESQQDKITRNRNKRVEDRKERRKRRDEEQKVKY